MDRDEDGDRLADREIAGDREPLDERDTDGDRVAADDLESPDDREGPADRENDDPRCATGDGRLAASARSTNQAAQNRADTATAMEGIFKLRPESGRRIEALMTVSLPVGPTLPSRSDDAIDVPSIHIVRPQTARGNTSSFSAVGCTPRSLQGLGGELVGRTDGTSSDRSIQIGLTT